MLLKAAMSKPVLSGPEREEAQQRAQAIAAAERWTGVSDERSSSGVSAASEI